MSQMVLGFMEQSGGDKVGGGIELNWGSSTGDKVTGWGEFISVRSRRGAKVCQKNRYREQSRQYVSVPRKQHRDIYIAQ